MCTTIIVLFCLTAAPDEAFEALAREEGRQAAAVEASTEPAEPAAADPAVNSGASSGARAEGPRHDPAAASTPPGEEAGAWGEAFTAATWSAEPAAAPAVSGLVMKAIGRQRSWRLVLAMGADHQHGNAMDWLGTAPSPTVSARAERRLDAAMPGLSAYGAGDLWSRGNSSHPIALSILHSEVEAGASFDLPASGLWGSLFPYARVGLTLGYARVRAGKRLAGSALVFGISAGAGGRLHLGSLLFAFGEAGYVYRVPRQIKLKRTGEEEDNPFLPGPAVRLGRLELAGVSWQAGIGVAF